MFSLKLYYWFCMFQKESSWFSGIRGSVDQCAYAWWKSALVLGFGSFPHHRRLDRFDQLFSLLSLIIFMCLGEKFPGHMRDKAPKYDWKKYLNIEWCCHFSDDDNGYCTLNVFCNVKLWGRRFMNSAINDTRFFLSRHHLICSLSRRFYLYCKTLHFSYVICLLK